MNRIDRIHGGLLGMAAGDALGTTIEFTPKQNPHKPTVVDIVGGGPFRLPSGAWTDDTSMGLCLAASLIESKGFDPLDQMNRYLMWRKHGYMSSIGRCFDIGCATSSALSRFELSGDPYAGSVDPSTAGNGSIMRLVAVPLFARSLHEAIVWSMRSSQTTHGAEECVQACALFGALIWLASHGCPKEFLLSDAMNETLEPHLFFLTGKVRDIFKGSYRSKTWEHINGSGYVVASLEAALWAIHNTNNFRDGAILAVNLGQDADTTGAVYGQLAGTLYGCGVEKTDPGIPTEWVMKVLKRGMIMGLAEQLNEVAEQRNDV